MGVRGRQVQHVRKRVVQQGSREEPVEEGRSDIGIGVRGGRRQDGQNQEGQREEQVDDQRGATSVVSRLQREHEGGRPYM